MKNKTITGNWYTPEEYLKTKKSVVYTSLLNTSSSAGDWDGIFIRKQGDKYKVFSFYQENRGLSGFNLYIGSLLFETKKELTNTRLEAIERLAYKILTF